MQSFREILKYIGDFQARLLLTVFYFTLALPFGLLARWGIDPLRLRRLSPATSAWQERRTRATDLSAAQRQTWV
jgi:hypothetical protein